MLVPIIIALWFGYLANRCGKGVLEWALAGAFLTFILNTALLNVAVLLVPDSIIESTDFSAYFIVRIIPAILTIIVMLIVGKIFLIAKLPKAADASAADSTADPVSEAPEGQGQDGERPSRP